MKRYDTYDREVIWLTVHYSPRTKGWFIETTYPVFITDEIAKGFERIEGNDIVYMVRGFDNRLDAKQFAVDYHEAKRDGNICRLRLD